jgi:hypothetical protein
MIIEKTASKVVQGSLVIYTTSLKVSDLNKHTSRYKWE